MNRKRILSILVIIILVVVGIGYYKYNKAPETVDDKEGTPVAAESLTMAFTSDETKANTQYLSQVLSVTGIISESSLNQDGATVILLQSDDPLSGVQCTMKEKNSHLKNGERITVKGFCTGYTTVVLLSECILEK